MSSLSAGNILTNREDHSTLVLMYPGGIVTNVEQSVKYYLNANINEEEVEDYKPNGTIKTNNGEQVKYLPLFCISGNCATM